MVPCQFVKRGCTAQVRLSNMKWHTTSECPYRDATCAHCQATIAAAKMEVSEQSTGRGE